jgi:hypothetical protein
MHPRDGRHSAALDRHPALALLGAQIDPERGRSDVRKQATQGATARPAESNRRPNAKKAARHTSPRNATRLLAAFGRSIWPTRYPINNGQGGNRTPDTRIFRPSVGCLSSLVEQR